ncbi:putative histone-like DNA-binding protein [Parabacteroides sp. PF5-5]|uniref:HU family DNA-binding protein n=1 Tax=unclassified Parabacteroides TaxID=2649774 RepID=UPI00247729A3|nr:MULTISPECIES: HU family DNA-binding protein [unclassified Parabacteroides]MDH6306533.1 putative histone-like DNA-binding protein [Parabacteroides sp. PH5-39]MDH6317500.1 putative histone-like DNA-binding protein [Parabacteroides sp. PF5-13]MDH6321197.1 putative histone-like DNA-binding protein [Parabacteroides sp. PH5-13]MDH6324929.1 putative histone-like DNA-binding protein [Parabacteroides sp. PH5-8]MDH6328638.1 putative histone-like DNA-binding protein [Parabacteroides sp. PH5-41]
MGLYYDFYESPSAKDTSERTRLHARVVTSGTTTTDELVETIHSNSTLTTADAKAALISFVEVMGKELSRGRRVHLEGLGYFQLTLSSPPVQSAKEVRAESVRVKSVAFRAETSFKKRFTAVELERAKTKRHSNRYSETEIDGLLTAYFHDHHHITRREFARLCGFTESTAKRRLQALLAAGKLRNAGYRNFSLYEPVEGSVFDPDISSSGASRQD